MCAPEKEKTWLKSFETVTNDTRYMPETRMENGNHGVVPRHRSLQLTTAAGQPAAIATPPVTTTAAASAGQLSQLC